MKLVVVVVTGRGTNRAGGQAGEIRRGLGGGRRRLDVADVVGGDAVEAVGVADLPREGRRGLASWRICQSVVGAAVVGDVDVVGRRCRSRRVVAPGPGHREAGACSRWPATRRRCWSGGPASMVLVTTAVFSGGVGVEDDRRLLVDGGAGGQAGVGLDGVLDVAVAIDGALALGVEEAVEDARRGLAGERVERDEGDGQQAGLDVEVERRLARSRTSRRCSGS